MISTKIIVIAIIVYYNLSINLISYYYYEFNKERQKLLMYICRKLRMKK